jgi:hAT family C-terminal dimerisation region
VQGCSPLTICEVFDAILENEYPDMDYYLAPTSDIVNNPNFESGLVKVLARNHLSLKSSEKQAISNLLKTSSLPSQGIGSSIPQMSYFEELQKRNCCRLSYEQGQYIDCWFCIATSNTAERLFSTCKDLLTDQRNCMSPIMFEALLFLKVNREMWDLTMVTIAMKNKEPREMNRDLDIYYYA